MRFHPNHPVDNNRGQRVVWNLLQSALAENVGLAGASIVLIDGRSKKYRTTISPREYKTIRALADEYLRRRPRSVLRP